MKLTGEEMYAIYTKKFLILGIEMDGWDNIKATDKAVWIAMAEEFMWRNV